MKYLIFILLLCVACSKEPRNLIRQGDNFVKPQKPTLPFMGKVLEFEITFDEDWYGSPFCENPRYGLKTYQVGHINYHRGGATWVVVSEDGWLYAYPYWYGETKTGVYDLHSESIYKRMLEPDQKYTLKIVFLKTTDFYMDGHLIFSAPELPHGWIAPPFLGKGTDDNYTEQNEPAGAARDLLLNIIMR